MQTIQSNKELRIAIKLLEEELALEKKELLANARTLLENLNPITPIKDALNKVKSPTEEKGKILKSIMGIGAELILKKFIPGKSESFIKTILSALFKLGSNYGLNKGQEFVTALDQEILDVSEEII